MSDQTTSRRITIKLLQLAVFCLIFWTLAKVVQHGNILIFSAAVTAGLLLLFGFSLVVLKVQDYLKSRSERPDHPAGARPPSTPHAYDKLPQPAKGTPIQEPRT